MLRLREGCFAPITSKEDSKKFRDFFDKNYCNVLGVSHNLAFEFDGRNPWCYGIEKGVLRCCRVDGLCKKGLNLVLELEELLLPPEEKSITLETVSMRQFETGATRNTEEGKLDYEGFLSPTALEAFANYMNSHRLQADGKLRDSDNWMKGIPIDVYMKSMWRHFFDTWKNHRGLTTPEDQITNLCALMFNVQGMMHELIKKQE